MTGKYRHLKEKLLQLLQHFPVVAILGARQTGKTTLSRQTVPEWKYFDFENPQDFELITRDMSFFFSQYPQAVILDEVQSSPEIFSVLRGVIDANRAQKGRFLLTGSSSPELVKHLSETLAGRIAYVELGTMKMTELFNQPLSIFYEIFSHKLSTTLPMSGVSPLSRMQLQSAWLKGGYPEPNLDDNAFFFQQWMENYRESYVYRDLGRWFPRLNKIAYRRFLTTLGNISGTILTKSDLARDIEVSEPTIKEYLSIVEGTYFWRSLPSFETNVRKAVVKMPRGHIRDSGLLHFLLKISDIDQLLSHQAVGRSFESFVIEEIFKGLHATSVTNWQGYYYRTRHGAEIDLILEGPFGLLPIEIKSGLFTPTKQLHVMQEFLEDHQLPLGILINQSTEIQWLTSKIVQIPATWL